ncbi:MAG: DNA polymerase III subunit delta' [Desulfarculaceae bacterium]|nr:DNA polymerase III subunit delta' [Desulfarculaceae bacterium]MCF8073679.1 DNA polymerase III subunit delta' [Desulfarculaceae bacterium]MCF8101920.1 DNA polymerase III subunit delta' [Desulfarculaceae bacterium]MCF8117657.1 DNA polymerase III subunit delta' [Desulfarculaceae bacterium]
MAQLEDELEAGRLAHAYLFAGPRGVGRTTTALALFAAANCEQPEGGQACAGCGSCRRIAAGTHEDLIVLEPPSAARSSQIKVEAVREAIRATGFAPFAGGVRLILIKQAGHLNPASANALLKTLEEPPPNNILVLTVSDPKELLPTLVSRCRKVNFMPLTPEQIQAELERRGEAPEEARLKAGLAGGSLGRALELDTAVLRHDLERLLGRLHGGGALEDWSFADKLVGDHRGSGGIDREGISQALDLLALHFRDAAVSAAGRPELACLPAAGPAHDISAACAAFARVRRAQGQILGNAAPELALVVLLGELKEAAVHG